MNCNSRIPGGALSSAFGGSKFLNGKLSLSSARRTGRRHITAARQTRRLPVPERRPSLDS